jgi:hypothetical protein
MVYYNNNNIDKKNQRFVRNKVNNNKSYGYDNKNKKQSE